MNKLKIGLLCFTIGFSFNGFSQLSNFDLSKYKLPDLERRSLETNFNISGNNNYRKPSNPTIYEKMGYNQYNSDIYLNYKHYLNSSEYQRESNFGIYFSSGFYNRVEDKELLYKNSNISPLLIFQRDFRKYYNGLSFFETDLVLNYQYGFNKSFSRNRSNDSESKDNSQTHDVIAYVPLKLGIGRIEPVQDARHAVYLFDELSKIGRMQSDKSDEQIIEFAQLISQLKNKRFFDSRLRRMAELESIDSFLMSKKYVSEQDAKYFTTLSDFWDYGNRPYRNSGTRYSVALLPGYYYYDYNYVGEGPYSDTSKYNRGALLLNGGIELKHEKPINLFWQNSIELNCYAGIIEGKINDKTDSIENKIRIPNIQLGFYQTIGFYPNTRTEMSFGYSFQYIQLFDKTDLQKEILGAEGKGLKAAADLSINYYVSPKLRLNVTSSFYYIWQDSKNDVIINFDNVAGSLLGHSASNTIVFNNNLMLTDITNSFRISLIYSIF